MKLKLIFITFLAVFSDTYGKRLSKLHAKLQNQSLSSVKSKFWITAFCESKFIECFISSDVTLFHYGESINEKTIKRFEDIASYFHYQPKVRNLWYFYNASQKHESTLLHTFVLNKFLIADCSYTTKCFWKNSYAKVIYPPFI